LNVSHPEFSRTSNNIISYFHAIPEALSKGPMAGHKV